jgi:hypothetical protein
MSKTIGMFALALGFAMAASHYDGAKGEETIIRVWGMGPAISTPAGVR